MADYEKYRYTGPGDADVEPEGLSTARSGRYANGAPAGYHGACVPYASNSPNTIVELSTDTSTE